MPLKVEKLNIFLVSEASVLVLVINYGFYLVSEVIQFHTIRDRDISEGDIDRLSSTDLIIRDDTS